MLTTCQLAVVKVETYKEDGFVFYMFFAGQAENGKFWVGYSTNNQNFTFYAWAD